MPEVYVHLAEGRSQEQKRAVMQDITESIVMRLGVDPANVVVTVIETSRTNKMKGGVLFSER